MASDTAPTPVSEGRAIEMLEERLAFWNHPSPHLRCHHRLRLSLAAGRLALSRGITGGWVAIKHKAEVLAWLNIDACREDR